MLIFGELCNANMPMGNLNGVSHKPDYSPHFLRNLLIITPSTHTAAIVHNSIFLSHKKISTATLCNHQPNRCIAHRAQLPQP